MRKSNIKRDFTCILTIFISIRYRRSYDSEYSAPLVAYYIWPALMDGTTCVSKGEAFTKRGAVSYNNRLNNNNNDNSK